jgi:phosphotransferase system  glucose/maltose/N-acetylglucosamine-specific IIC component
MLAGVSLLLPDALTSSAPLILVGGIVLAIVALFGFELSLALRLSSTAGRAEWRAAFDVTRADLPIFIAIGVAAGGCAWIGSRVGVAGAAVALMVVALLAAAVLLRRRRGARMEELVEERQILDVVRSALLDLPASRLPDDL